MKSILTTFLSLKETNNVSYEESTSSVIINLTGFDLDEQKKIVKSIKMTSVKIGVVCDTYSFYRWLKYLGFSHIGQSNILYNHDLIYIEKTHKFFGKPSDLDIWSLEDEESLINFYNEDEHQTVRMPLLNISVEYRDLNISISSDASGLRFVRIDNIYLDDVQLLLSFVLSTSKFYNGRVRFTAKDYFGFSKHFVQISQDEVVLTKLGNGNVKYLDCVYIRNIVRGE